MLIANDYILMVPGFVEGKSRKIVLYEVQSMLDLQKSDKLLRGHPSLDLPDFAWGTLNFSVHRVKRWLEKDRLVKLRANPGGSIRMTFCEPKEWRKYLSEEQWQWLCQVCEVSQLYCEEIAKQAKAEVEPKKEKPKKKKFKAKDRRKRQKREEIYGQIL